MSKIEIDLASVEQVEILLNDVIDIYNKAIATIENTSIPYNFERKYAYQNNYSAIKRDKNNLIELKDFVKNSVKDLNSLDETLTNQARNLPTNSIKQKDFSL